MITKTIRKFEKVESEVKIPAILNLQVWDNDTLSPDDFLGSLSINLSNFPSPFAAPEKVRKRKVDELNENLFATDDSIRGWFPVYGNVEGVEGNKQTVRLSRRTAESFK